MVHLRVLFSNVVQGTRKQLVLLLHSSSDPGLVLTSGVGCVEFEFSPCNHTGFSSCPTETGRLNSY